MSVGMLLSRTRAVVVGCLYVTRRVDFWELDTETSTFASCSSGRPAPHFLHRLLGVLERFPNFVPYCSVTAVTEFAATYQTQNCAVSLGERNVFVEWVTPFHIQGPIFGSRPGDWLHWEALHANARMLPEVTPQSLPFQSIIHWSSYHMTLFNLRYWRCR
jgi:hypothetical protein